MRMLVAGGGGFIGSHLIDRLLDQDHAVTVVDNFVTGRRQNLAHRCDDERLTLVEADVADATDVAGLSGPYDRVFHLASPASPIGYGRHPLETLLVNSAGTHNLLELARRDGARFLLTSTSEVYGEPLVHPQREDYWGNVNPIGPRSCYDEGKRFAESLTTTYSRQHRLDVRIARLFNTYGPRMAPADGRVIPNFCVQALAGEPLTVYGDGSQTRSLCYVADTVRGLLALMEVPGLAGEVVNLGNPVETTIRAIAEAVIAATGSASPLVYRPLPIDDPTRRQPDVAKARRLLGWAPEIVFADGLPPTVAAFRADLTGSPRGEPVLSRQR